MQKTLYCHASEHFVPADQFQRYYYIRDKNKNASICEYVPNDKVNEVIKSRKLSIEAVCQKCKKKNRNVLYWSKKHKKPVVLPIEQCRAGIYEARKFAIEIIMDAIENYARSKMPVVGTANWKYLNKMQSVNKKDFYRKWITIESDSVQLICGVFNIDFETFKERITSLFDMIDNQPYVTKEDGKVIKSNVNVRTYLTEIFKV